MAKFITKSIHERLDNFVFQDKNEELVNKSTNSIESDNSNKKRVLKKKSDGLIEKMDNKIIITEDNRELLND